MEIATFPPYPTSPAIPQLLHPIGPTLLGSWVCSGTPHPRQQTMCSRALPACVMTSWAKGSRGMGRRMGDGWWVMGDPNPNPPDSDLDVCCRMRMMMMMVMMMVIPHANTDVSSCCEWNCCIYLDIFPALTQLIKKTGLQSTGITSKTAMQWPGRVHIEKTHRLMTPQNQDVTTNYILGL